MLNSILGRTAQLALLFGGIALIMAPTSAHAEEPPTTTKEDTTKEDTTKEDKVKEEVVEEKEEAAVEKAFPWELDYSKAVARAKAEGKDLMVNFTGSDWCHWCIKLDEEVFAKGTFAEDAGKKFVFVFMDFPHDEALKAKVVDPKVNDELRDKHAVQGFPTILLMSAEGTVFGQTGYRKGGPEGYLKHLTELQDNGQKIVALAKNKDKVDVEGLKAGIEALQANKMLTKPAYRWAIDKARELDPDGTHGLRVHADRMDEKQAFKALLPQKRGDKPDWPKLYTFIKTAKYLEEDGMFVNASVGAVQEYLIKQKMFDEAEALTKRIQGLKMLAENDGAQKYLEEILSKVAKARAAAEDSTEEEKPVTVPSEDSK